MQQLLLLHPSLLAPIDCAPFSTRSADRRLSVSKNEIELICKCIGGSCAPRTARSIRWSHPPARRLPLEGGSSMQSCSRRISDVRNTSQITTKNVNKVKCSSDPSHFLHLPISLSPARNPRSSDLSKGWARPTNTLDSRKKNHERIAKSGMIQ